MKKLISKELKLALHPTSYIFLLLSAMLLIPNYPYYVVFFYTGLGIFFTCLLGRENKDIFFTALLPVSKGEIVKARMCAAVITELLQLTVCIPFAFIRRAMPAGPNAAGMDANIALFGLGLIMLGIFNIVFFGLYYKDVQRVGRSFTVASIVTFVYIFIAETFAHAVPFFRDCLDNYDPKYIPQRVIVLVIGIASFSAMTFGTYKKAVRDFERLDL